MDQDGTGHGDEDAESGHSVVEDLEPVQEGSLQPEKPPACAACGGEISADDLVCPHCGESLAGG